MPDIESHHQELDNIIQVIRDAQEMDKTEFQIKFGEHELDFRHDTDSALIVKNVALTLLKSAMYGVQVRIEKAKNHELTRQVNEFKRTTGASRGTSSNVEGPIKPAE